jgi:hypothetical protein
VRAVWSFWTKPFRAGRGSRWLTDYHAHLAWGLSVELARRHYPDTLLVTDDDGAELLVDQLKLPFSSVSLELNRLHDRDPDWWALGKLCAYRLQTEPFVHIDSDVFLWKRLPAALEAAPVFAQSPEEFDPNRDGHFYPLRAVENTFYGTAEDRGRGWLPDAWLAYSAQRGPLRAACCGVVGGTRTDVLREVAEHGIRVVEAPENAAGWAAWGDKGYCNVLIEQFLLNAVVERRRELEWVESDSELRIAYLFPTDAEAYDPARAEAVGYTHVIGGAKRNAELMADLEARMWADYPEFAERCHALGVGVPASGGPS